MRAGLQPERAGYSFLRDGDGVESNLTYAELDRRARGLGAALQRLGAAGERALLLYPPGLDYVAAFFGCLYGGTAAVPAYPPRPNRPSPRVRSIVENATPRVILTTAALRPKLESILQVPGGTEWLVTDDPLQPVTGATDLDALADDWRDPGVEPSALAFLQYTSGSTAAPKGVRLSHANLLHNLELIRACFAQTERERTVIWLPPYHDMGLIGGILEPLYAGYPVTLLSPLAFLQQPVRWLRAISNTRATTSGGPNFAYDLCVRKITEEQKQDLDLSSWSLAFNGAEPIRADTLDRFTAAFSPCGFRREAFYPCYGLAEATLLVAAGRRFSGPIVRSFNANELENHRAVEAADDAKPLAGCGLAADPQPGYPAIVVVRTGSPEPCAPGEVGEIWVQGPSVAQGYWRQPEETERVFGARLSDGSGPFLRTGDLGFVAEGELFVTGRLKDLIILRGRNHYPQDIELAVERSHAALRPGCVAAFAVEREGEERLAVVAEVHREHRQDDEAEIAGIVAAIRRAVADEHEVAPAAVVLLRPATLPKTSSGKIQRHACRAGYLAGTLAAIASWTAGNEADLTDPTDLTNPTDSDDLLRWLAGEVARRSGVAPGSIDPRQSIASYALDSLATIELMHAIENRIGASVEMETLFSEMSLTDLAASLRGRQGEPTTAIAVTESGDFPLSRAQMSLWFLHALAPESPAYNVPNAVRVRGDLDAAALLGALQTLVDRHPVLRTTFVAVAGEPAQRVAPMGELEVATHDASTWGEDQLAAHLDAESQRPFDLEHGPLARVVVYSRSPIDHVLLLTMHHIVTDFWSLGVLLDELSELYGGHCAGRAPQLPPQPPTYADWTLWQERELSGPAGDVLWNYWRESLSGELPVLELPPDRPRPLVQGTAGRAHKSSLAEPLTGEVRRLAREAGTTPFVVLLAAFETLLHRYSGQPEMLLGTVSAARTRAAFSRTAGYFVNPLVLRADLRGDPGFGSLLARSRRDAQGAFTHQDYPFPLLVEKLQPQRDASRSPLFQVMFVMQKAMLADGQDLTGFALGEPGSRVELGGLAMETIPLPQRIAQFDLTLTVGEVGGRLVASFDSNVDLFDAATIQRLAGHFEHLLAAALAEPGRAVSELPLLDASERRQLIEVWNDTLAPFHDQATLADLFAQQVAATPAATAVIFAGQELTYAELDRHARQLASTLRRLGVGPEELVGICVERSFDVVVAALGVLGAGGAYLPIDPEYPRERIAHLVTSAGARLILSHRVLLPLVDQGVDGPRVVCLDEDQRPSSPQPSSPAPSQPPHREKRETCEAASTGFPSPGVGGWEGAGEGSGVRVLGGGSSEGRRALPANLACAIFTSGSTGLPKGVLLDHANLVNLVDSFAHSYRPTPDDRILPMTSIAYASFVGEVFPLLCTGGTVVLPQKHELLDVAALVSLIARHRVTMVSTVPSMLASLDALGDRLPRLRLLLIGGEALTTADVAGLLARAGELRIVNGYGLTETAVCSTIYDVEPADLAAGRQPPIGKPLPNQRAYVLDRHLEPRPVGCAGELYIAGLGVARGYAGRPDLTAARFLPDPFTAGGRMYRTGDLAAVRADGNLVYLGRGDQQVKLRGFRIELPEIESVLAHLPGVRAAAVVVRHDDGEPRLVGYVVPEESVPTADPAKLLTDLRRGLRERLPDYMVPAALVFLDELPRTVNGKLDAARLPAPAHTRPELAAAYAAPRSELERSIAAVWSAALKLESVGLDDNFFDLGGHSLLMAKVHARLGEALGRMVSLIELFQYPTVGSLARHLARGTEPETANEARGSLPSARRPPRQSSGIETDIAVIGLSGRFPGAADVSRLWLNLVAGREGIRFFTAEELIAAGVDPDLVARPDYVKAKGILGNVDQFDAAFFGLNPREVELMDPQHRIFLECAWEALEDAGWEADRYPGLIGVYAGLSMNTYLLMNLVSHMELVASADTLQASLGNDKDPLTSRVSYKLNLKGPSITIQSASSTSLVAVHTACQALINRDCDMALTGGVSIHLPETAGYLYQEGGTVARDGHCRAFDAASTGFVSGHGCGVVVLKRLSEALADRDHVYAVIKGSACNNDGSHKVSFMAPSVDGQIQLYNLAYDNAGVDPATVSYVECHGTGTAIGDPIEIGALSQAFAARTERKGFCAIGSLKTNIGHLDTAAGVCGLIKAVLCLHHRTLPPSLHFSTPNPRIDFANSPFFVNTELRPWEPADGAPRRAGVTSLGMGGTNAHVVLEEAPAATSERHARPWQLLVLSAKSANALDSATFRLAEHLRDQPSLPLADVAFTLQVGRKAFQHRRVLLCRDLPEAALALETLDPERVLTLTATPGEHPVAFLFPGQGAQYVDMGRGLYDGEPVFRDAVDRCCEHLPFDLRATLWNPAETDLQAAAEHLQQTEIAQPALFVVSWAAAQLWLSWGVRPAALLGHSIGEYVAGCLAGVFSLEDALALVVERGRLMQQMAPGAMLAVPLPEAEIVSILDRTAGELSLAAVNRPNLCVVSGHPAAIDTLAASLAAAGLMARQLHTSHAFHSHTADPILESFAAAVRRVRLSPPSIPLVSNVTGGWLRPEDATDPEYWVRQLRGTVRFADGLAQLLAEPQRILLEVGPGDTLSSFAREYPARLPEQAVIPSMRHTKSAIDDVAVLQRAIARLWLSGGNFDWEAFGAAEERRRVSLPTYPFERQRYWVDPLPEKERPGRRQPDPKDWTYAPVWKPAPLPGPAENGSTGLWLLLLDHPHSAADLGTLLADHLAAAGHWVVQAFAGEGFARLDASTFTVAPGRAADLEELLAFLAETPAHIVHLWAFSADSAAPVDPCGALDRGFYSLLFLAQALGKRDLAKPASLLMVTAGLQTGDEPQSPFSIPSLGPTGVLPRELPNVLCKVLDVLPPADSWEATEIVEQILVESAHATEPWVALRHGQRFVRSFEIVPSAVEAAVATQSAEASPERAASSSSDHPRPALANPYVAPEDELEQQIAAVWQEVLGVDRVGLHDNFFELGGNSLAGLRVVGRLKERLQVGVSEVSLYEAPTVAALARLVGAESKAEPDAAAHSFEARRSRGERRKAKQLQKARVGERVYLQLEEPPAVTSNAPPERGSGPWTHERESELREPLRIPSERRGDPPENPPADKSPAPNRETPPDRHISAWIYERESEPRKPLRIGKSYTLKLKVGSPVATSLFAGPDSLVPDADVPKGGLATRWVITSASVALSAFQGDASVNATTLESLPGWKASFALLIPKEGESAIPSLRITPQSGEDAMLEVMIYARDEVYRQLAIRLSVEQRDHPAVTVEREVLHSPIRHLDLKNLHDWEIPPGTLTVSVLGDRAVVRGTIAERQEVEDVVEWFGGGGTIAGRIENVRSAAEKLRQMRSVESLLNAIDPMDLLNRLASFQPPNNWDQLQFQADAEHEEAWAKVSVSTELHNLAIYGYKFYDAFFPKGQSRLRGWLDSLQAGHRLNISWLRVSGATWLSHVPWGLMYRSIPPELGTPVEPLDFLGLRFRIDYSSRSQAGTKGLGRMEDTYHAHLMYWGDDEPTGGEALWQRALWKNWGKEITLPRLPTRTDPKNELVKLLDCPPVAPLTLLYLFCKCTVGDGNEPILTFANTKDTSALIRQTELGLSDLADRPLVFANACTTAAADPDRTNELAANFFDRGCRAFLGTETKVPILLASRFAAIFFHFFFRRIDPDPISAGEAVAQTRLLLWTQYRNLGGLFYSYVNRYELFMASDDEVAALRS